MSAEGGKEPPGHPVRWNDPSTYIEWVRETLPAYDRLQDEVAKATEDVAADRILDLGTGTGETALRVLDLHPAAELVGIDGSETMLATARERLADRNATFEVARLEDPLPPGPFELITSALAIHHLAPSDKQLLFSRVAESLVPGGRFVIADIVVPEDPADALCELSESDHPSSLADQLDWLRAAGLRPETRWVSQDIAVIAADRP